MARPDLLLDLGQAARSEAPGADAAFETALDRVLAQASAEAAPQPDLRGLVHERLQHSLAAGAAAAAGAGNLAGSASGAHTASDTYAAVSRGVWTRYGSKLIILATGVAIGFAWGRAPSWRDEVAESGRAASVPAASTQTDRTSASLTPAAAPAVSPAPASPAEGETPIPKVIAGPPAPASATEATPRVGVAARPPAARTHTAPRARAHAPIGAAEQAESLRLVLQQLRKTQLFSRAGEHRLALGALDELDARVPLSVLQEEREVARTLALCDAGQEEAAAELAARVIERAPGSAYALSLHESCAGRARLLEQMRDRTSNQVP